MIIFIALLSIILVYSGGLDPKVLCKTPNTNTGSTHITTEYASYSGTGTIDGSSSCRGQNFIPEARNQVPVGLPLSKNQPYNGEQYPISPEILPVIKSHQIDRDQILQMIQEVDGQVLGRTTTLIHHKQYPKWIDRHYPLPGNYRPDFTLFTSDIGQSTIEHINAGITTQLLLSLFNIDGVVHYGIAGNADPSLNIGDVAIPKFRSHTALWNWQRYGDGPENELALEVNGDYTREFGYLKFSDYTTVNETKTRRLFENLLNNVWYQPEEVFPVDGTPESREHAFWVSVDKHYYTISKKLEGLKLESCINSTTCLSNTPKVVTVLRGASANIYLDNAAYRSFIYKKFHVSPVDMKSASVALICLQQRVPYIAFRALSDLAGGGSADSNEAATFTSLAATNSVTVVIEFIKELFVSSGTSVM